MIKRTETENTVQFELCRGTKLQLNKNAMTEVGEALDLLCRLEKSLQRLMPMPADKIAEIVEAYADDRLTIWPRYGQELWFDATGMCEHCPAQNSDQCPHPDDGGFGFYHDCIRYVDSEPWPGGEDTTQREAFLDGYYYLTEDAAVLAVLAKGDQEE